MRSGGISLPVIFSVARWRDRYLVNGGLVNPAPVNLAGEMGADYVIAVNVIPEMAERIHGSIDPKTGKQKAPGLIGIITQTIYVSRYALTSVCLKDADIVIRPRLGHIGFMTLTMLRNASGRARLPLRMPFRKSGNVWV
jgi:NTE family protein